MKSPLATKKTKYIFRQRDIVTQNNQVAMTSSLPGSGIPVFSEKGVELDSGLCVE